ncbi:MBL fold metallo-hydrolase [Yokenella regensburgei]|uniref:MBL fold metallo-hydrolase n=1 Tax=Yokenella regensburgei TaxID=158877 RepID=UPI003F14C32F
MTIVIDVISGLNAKAPAAILISTPRQRILLDAGGALDPDDDPWPVPDNLDAVLLSHDHVDHIAGLDRLPSTIPVYCTALTAQALPSGHDIQIIPVRGQFQLGEITVTTGSSGHALGGVWFHLNVAGGIFYSGDFSMESTIFHFDTPPPAQVALLDASYGLYDVAQHEQWAKLQGCFTRPTLCPVPPSGRAVELALLLAREGDTDMALDAPCLALLRQMVDCNDGSVREDVVGALQQLLQTLAPFSPEVKILFAADPDGQSGMAGELRARGDFYHRTLFTGHLNRVARQQWQKGDVDFCRWNVHPTRQSLQALVAMLDCRKLFPLFTPIEDIGRWQQALQCEIADFHYLSLTR